MSWETIYRQAETVWGEKPDHLLMELAPKVPMGRVLDLGMGEGRNLLPFAQQGYEAYGIDVAPAGVEKCLERARVLNISVSAHAQDMRLVNLDAGTLKLVICAMSLQFMKYAESETLLRRIKAALQPGGFVYLTVFSTEDPWLERLKTADTAVETNTYFVERMETHVHFFEKDELLTPLMGLKLHHFAQTVLLDPGHPGVPQPHYHGILTYIGQQD